LVFLFDNRRNSLERRRRWSIQSMCGAFLYFLCISSKRLNWWFFN
jgi:hypothetical protein